MNRSLVVSLVMVERHTSNIGSDSVTLGETGNLGSHVDDGSNSLVSRNQLDHQPGSVIKVEEEHTGNLAMNSPSWM